MSIKYEGKQLSTGRTWTKEITEQTIADNWAIFKNPGELPVLAQELVDHWNKIGYGEGKYFFRLLEK